MCVGEQGFEGHGQVLSYRGALGQAGSFQKPGWL